MKVLRRSPSVSRQYANSIPSVYQQYIINTPSVYLQYTISIPSVWRQYANSLPGLTMRPVRSCSPYTWKQLETWSTISEHMRMLELCCYHSLLPHLPQFPHPLNRAMSLPFDHPWAKWSSPTASLSALLKLHPSAKKRCPRIAEGSKEIKEGSSTLSSKDWQAKDSKLSEGQQCHSGKFPTCRHENL